MKKMRSLKRNQSLVYYAEYGGKVPIYDENGFPTGDEEVIYSDPKPLWVHVTAAQGNAYSSIFGTAVDYTKKLGPVEEDLDIDENTILWVDTSDTTADYDYIVTRVAKGLNATHYAIK